MPTETRDRESLNIISASRRTDIPAFYMPWFVNRLRAGSVCYPNPFSGEVYTVSLRPEDVHSIVFWSKYYGRFLSHLDELAESGYRFYCHYTITGSPELLEPHVPDWQKAVQVFRKLAERTSSRHVQWRFDPILLTDELDAAFYLERFQVIAAALSGATSRCYFSFAQFYGKAERRLQRARIQYRDPELEEKLAIVAAMADIADRHGIALYACCQEVLATGLAQKAHCIDGELLAELFPDRPRVSRFQPSRKECGCVISRDIGLYDTCPYGCVYCYANNSSDAVSKRFRAHDPEGEMLIGQKITEGDREWAKKQR